MSDATRHGRCDELADLLPLAATGDVTVQEDLEVEDHLVGCAACRDEMQAYRKLCATASQELAPVPALPPLAAAGGGAATGSRSSRWAGRLAVAAALLLAGVVAGLWGGHLVQTPASRTDAAGPGAGPIAATSPVELARARAGALSVFSPAARPYLMAVAQGGQAMRDDE
jgi:predicted anti-sigma-YlaC factor YlaD